MQKRKTNKTHTQTNKQKLNIKFMQKKKQKNYCKYEKYVWKLKELNNINNKKKNNKKKSKN